MSDSKETPVQEMHKKRAARKTISTSSPVSDMFRKLRTDVGPEIRSSQLSNAERSKLINMSRAKPEVPPPQWFRLTEEELYPNGAKLPDHDLLKKHLREEGRLTLNCAMKLLGQASELLRQEPNMLNLTNHIPLRICGDIHGQFYDLLNLVEMAGDPKRDSFLFLGDYVDRGMFSTEVVLYLASLKINFPNKIFMLRGNHECRLLTSHFNFMDEVVHKYDSEVYYMFMELFDVLPVAAFLENDIGRFLLVHGGISPELLDLSQINEIDRFVEPPGEGLLCDLLWSDPIDETTGDGLDAQEMLEWDSVDYVPNPDRGCSWVFGYSAITEFLEQLNLVSVIRAHEVQKAGFKEHRFLKQREHAHLITVFSAPNYCLADDMQVLTSRGFLFYPELREAAANDPAFAVAQFNPATQQLEYVPHSAEAITINEPSEQTMYAFMDTREAKRWTEENVYGCGSVDADSSNVSLVVTPNHRMYVQNGSVAGEGRCFKPQSDASGSYHKETAEAVFERGQESSAAVRMIARAQNGLCVASGSVDDSFVRELSLDTEEKVEAFLKLLGFVTANGELAANVTEGQQFLDAQLATLGVAYNAAWSKEGIYRVLITDERCAQWLVGAQSVPMWLSRGHAGWIHPFVEGLQWADGRSDAIRTTSVVFRDELVRLLLHGGYTCSFALESAEEGVECWRVQYALDHKTEAVMNVKSDVRAVQYNSYTWCVTVPSGLIMTRRALGVRGQAGELQKVVKASRPIVVGNCDQYNNKAAFMLMKEDSYEFVQTVHVGHPYYLPNFMDGLTYSLPFVMENLSRLAEDLITICLPKADEHVPEDEQEEVEHLRGKILALSRLRHVMGGLGEDRRASIKALTEPVPGAATAPKGATPGQLAKFEAALQMDFMREYLRPGAKVGDGSSKAPLYRGRSKSLNFLELGKTLGVKGSPIVPADRKNQAGPPRPNFLPPKKDGAAAPAAGAATAAPAASEEQVSPGSRRSSGRRERAKAVKFGKPPTLGDSAAAEEGGAPAEMSKKEKRKSKDDFDLSPSKQK